MEDEMKPTKLYIAKARQNRDGLGWVAVYGWPGAVPGVVSEHGRPVIYDDEEDARAAARIKLLEILNKPRRMAKKGKDEIYEHMSGPEFSVALREAGITPTFFAYIYGTSQARVLAWMDGSESVPHPARLMLAFFQHDPVTISIAEDITKAVTKPRRIRVKS